MKKLLVLIAAIPGMFVCGAHGQQISIQFLKGSDATAVSGSAGVVAADHWNPILSSTSNAPLVDNTGTATTGTLSVTYGNYFTGSTFADGTGDAALLAGGLNSSGGSVSSISVATIPYTTYNVYVYGVTDNGGNNGTATGLTTIFALTPTGGTTQFLSLQPVTDSPTYVQSTNTYSGSGTPATSGSFTAGANYVVFKNVTAPGFTLKFSGADATGAAESFNASLNGIQIIKVK